MNKYLLTLLSFILGSSAYFLISKLIDKLLCNIFDMHELWPFDEYFLYDQGPNRFGNVRSLFRCSKF